jgi:SAM-dependent methyltransferase
MPNGLALAIVLLVIMLFLAYIVSILLNFLTPFYTTPRKILSKLTDLFELKPSQTFVDLGSGDGRVVFDVYRKYKCKSVGYEISPVLLIYVKIKKLLTNPLNPKLNFREESFFKVDLEKYDVIYCCLPEDVLSILEDKFENELKEGSKVFIYNHRLPNKEGKVIDLDGKKVYQYTF